MKTIDQIKAAYEQAAKLQNKARDNGTKFRSMTYEDGLRDALDWVCDNIEEDPTEDA